MPRRKFIDKKNATTFALVHRAQNDPLIHDEDAPSMVFAEKGPSQSKPRRPTEDDYAYSDTASILTGSDAGHRSKKVKERGDLEEEFGLRVRKNEGEAAQHGVYYDDSEYDYMQHMRDLGSGEGPVTWLEASSAQKEKKVGKGKQRLEDALRNLDLESDAGRFDDAQSVGTSASSVARSLLPEDVLPSEFARKRTYQDQQNVPDEIAGFQPDMDLRLREVLEALEDEEYVDDEEDIFAELTRDGVEVEKDEWERLGEQQMFDEGEAELPAEDNDEGWESDDTIRAASPTPREVHIAADSEVARPPKDTQAPPPIDPTEGAWLNEFKKFKHESKVAGSTPYAAAAAPSGLASSALSSLASGRRKKRKGAKTSTTNYSMTSSALARTDQQTLLDSRFDKIEEEYSAAELPDEEEDGRFDDALSVGSGATGLSKSSRVSKYSTTSGLSGVSGVSSYSRATDSEAPQLQRSDFDSIMDGFLEGYSKTGKMGKRIRRGGPQTGMQQLDEIRNGLGPARVKSRAAS